MKHRRSAVIKSCHRLSPNVAAAMVGPADSVLAGRWAIMGEVLLLAMLNGPAHA
jgi:hypothetical protein